MKKIVKILFVSVMICIFASPAFSADLSDLQKHVDTFSEKISRVLPFNSTIGLNWSDAYIGQLLSKPPRFGVGFSAGATTMDIKFINELLKEFGTNEVHIPLLERFGFPIPAYTVEGRIGGFVLPFDIGVKIGYLPGLNIFDMKLDYLLVGADFRYALIDSKLFPLKLSVGVGYNYLSGGISRDIPGQSFSFNSYGITAGSSNLGFLWGTSTVELKVQVSYPVFFITPYAGVGASYAWTHAGYKVDSDSDLAISGGALDQFIKDVEKDLGINASKNGFESIVNNANFNIRAFGGLSFNMAVVRLDLTAMYNILGGNFGASLGLRFQL